MTIFSGERLHHILLLIPGDRYRRSHGKVVELLLMKIRGSNVFSRLGNGKYFHTPIKDNIAKHRAAHYISDVWLWAGCAMTGA